MCFTQCREPSVRVLREPVKTIIKKYYFMPFLDDEFILQKNSRGMFNKMFNIERSADE